MLLNEPKWQSFSENHDRHGKTIADADDLGLNDNSASIVLFC